MINQKNNDSNTLPSTPPDDSVSIRCPRLGHQINFSYCRAENNGLPCFKTLDCWFNYFNVHSFLKNKLTKEVFEKIFQVKGKAKVFSLIDLIDQAKERQGKKD